MGDSMAQKHLQTIPVLHNCKYRICLIKAALFYSAKQSVTGFLIKRHFFQRTDNWNDRRRTHGVMPAQLFDARKMQYFISPLYRSRRAPQAQSLFCFELVQESSLWVDLQEVFFDASITKRRSISVPNLHDNFPNSAPFAI